MKFGIDIHGVADTKVKFFSVFTRRLVEQGHEVHIITGSMWNERIEIHLEQLGINYTHYFSVSDYLINKGFKAKFSDVDNPWFPNSEWNRCKGEYCERLGIDLHFDDSDSYGQYFTKTKYFLVKKRGLV